MAWATFLALVVMLSDFPMKLLKIMNTTASRTMFPINSAII